MFYLRSRMRKHKSIRVHSSFTKQINEHLGIQCGVPCCQYYRVDDVVHAPVSSTLPLKTAPKRRFGRHDINKSQHL